MKILTVVSSLGKGGTQRAAQNFAEAYMLEGHDSRILFTHEDGIRGDELRAVGITVIDFQEPTAMASIKDWKPDLVHLHSHGLIESNVTSLLKVVSGARLVETNVFSTATPWQSHLDCSFQLSQWCLWVYFNRTHGSVPSREVGNPVRVGTFSRSTESEILAFRCEHGFESDHIVLGRIGQSYASKWSQHLIDSFNKLRVDDQRYRLLVVNPPDSIRLAISKSPFASDICIIDKLNGDDSLSLAYSSIDIFVLVAEQGESFGMVLAESLLCETPVVTLATPWADNSQGEVVGHEIGGIVANTPKDLRSGIALLANDRQKRTEFGRRGREYIIEKYEYRKIARQALEVSSRCRESARAVPPISLYSMTNSRVGWCSRFLLRFYSLKAMYIFINGYAPWDEFPGKILCSLRGK